MNSLSLPVVPTTSQAEPLRRPGRRASESLSSWSAGGGCRRVTGGVVAAPAAVLGGAMSPGRRGCAQREPDGAVRAGEGPRRPPDPGSATPAGAPQGTRPGCGSAARGAGRTRTSQEQRRPMPSGGPATPRARASSFTPHAPDPGTSSARTGTTREVKPGGRACRGHVRDGRPAGRPCDSRECLVRVLQPDDAEQLDPLLQGEHGCPRPRTAAASPSARSVPAVSGTRWAGPRTACSSARTTAPRGSRRS